VPGVTRDSACRLMTIVGLDGAMMCGDGWPVVALGLNGFGTWSKRRG